MPQRALRLPCRCSGPRHQPGHQARGGLPLLVQQALERHQICDDQPGAGGQQMAAGRKEGRAAGTAQRGGEAALATYSCGGVCACGADSAELLCRSGRPLHWTREDWQSLAAHGGRGRDPAAPGRPAAALTHPTVPCRCPLPPVLERSSSRLLSWTCRRCRLRAAGCSAG